MTIFVAAWLSPFVPLTPKFGFALGFVVLGGSALWVTSVEASVRASVGPNWSSDVDRGGWFRLAVAIVSLLLLGLVALLELRGAWVAALVGSALLWLGSVVGAGLGRRIEHAGHLLFVVWVSAVVDAVSVLHPRGVTHAVAESEIALSVLALPFPLLGTADIVPMLGVGDVVFMALYLAASRHHALPLWRTLAGLALGLLLTLFALLWFEVTTPALPLLGLGVVVMQPAARRPPRKQRGAALVLASTLSALALWLLWGRAGL